MGFFSCFFVLLYNYFENFLTVTENKHINFYFIENSFFDSALFMHKSYQNKLKKFFRNPLSIQIKNQIFARSNQMVF